ncbi:MAG: hypothetical protein M1556_00900 [Candidatus Thermoplasmatota archaeon]|nr:hypothetical protein [Candidatus Thermoplasmatota archaeon]MCL6002194.1 hypothetical protein [Candidatus Thermoplasmatota archaeon]
MKAEFNGQDKILLLGINKALKDSGKLVEQVLNSGNFDIILLSVTDEEVQGLREYIKSPVEVEMDDVEIIYEYFMKQFGETSIPPEAYISAVKVADKNGSEIRGIDIPSGMYEDIFVVNVQLSDMILLSLRRRRLLKKRWNFSSPGAFTAQWDTYLNKGGYMKVEKERAKYMATEVANKKKGNTVVIVESERFRDLVNDLNSTLQGYRVQESGEEMTTASSGKLS